MQAFNMRIDTIFSTFQLPAQKNILSAMHLQASQRFLVLLNLRYEKKSPLPEHQRAIIDFSSHAFSRFQMTQNLLDAETAQQIKYFSKRPFLGKYDIILSNIKKKGKTNMQLDKENIKKSDGSSHSQFSYIWVSRTCTQSSVLSEFCLAFSFRSSLALESLLSSIFQ